MDAQATEAAMILLWEKMNEVDHMTVGGRILRSAIDHLGFSLRAYLTGKL